jgi:hypothetical protein
MIKPRHHLADGRRLRSGRRRRPLHQDDADAEHACRGDLAVGGGAAAIFRHHHIDGMREKQGPFRVLFERSPGENVLGMRNRQGRVHRIDASNHVLVLGRGRKGSEFLPAHREEHLSRCNAERTRGFLCALNLVPPIGRNAAPGRPAQRDHRRIRLRGSAERMVRHRRCIGMSGINQCADRMLAHILGEACDAAEAAASHGDKLGHRRMSAAGQRQGRLHVLAQRELPPEFARLGRTAQNKDALSHVVR